MVVRLFSSERAPTCFMIGVQREYRLRYAHKTFVVFFTTKTTLKQKKKGKLHLQRTKIIMISIDKYKNKNIPYVLFD